MKLLDISTAILDPKGATSIGVRRNDPLAAAGEEDGVADLPEGLEIIGVDRGRRSWNRRSDGEEHEDCGGGRRDQIHGRAETE